MAELSMNPGWVITKDLIQECVAGNRASQELLYKKFAPKMFAICLRYADSKQSAEDILQEGFIKVFNHLDKYRSEGSFEGWVKRIFVNTSIEYYRKSIVAKRHVDIEKVYDHKSKEEDAVSKLARKDLVNMVQKLPPGYRTVFNLYAIEGYTHREISKLLGISEGTSKSQLARARAMLKRFLKNTK